MLTYYIMDIVIPLYSFNFIGNYLFKFIFVFVFEYEFLSVIVDGVEIVFIGIVNI
jgi:hypothetical protein